MASWIAKQEPKQGGGYGSGSAAASSGAPAPPTGSAGPRPEDSKDGNKLN